MFWKNLLDGKRLSRKERSRAASVRRAHLGVERLEDRALLTAVADLVAYRPITDSVNYALFPVAEANETDPKTGPGIRINGDDDNRNGRPDYSDTTTLETGDNDLLRVDVGGAGTTFQLSWTGPLAVWTTATKGGPITSGANVAPGQVWVEYASQTHTTSDSAKLTLTVRDASSTALDTVVFHSFRSDVIVLGGFTQTPGSAYDPNLGVFNIGLRLYQQGYDVYLYSHNQVQASGQGAAFNEVKNAVRNRNVDYVSILGYSWGGGATFELANGLRQDASLSGQYQLAYTAYIDAIRHYSISAERRRPPGSVYHDNFYQQRDWLLRGNSVTGANNINVTSTMWGKNLSHTAIDDHPIVQNSIINNLLTRVIA